MQRDFPVGRLGAAAAQWLAGQRAEPAAPRLAATVMLVRDARGSFEGQLGGAGPVEGQPRVAGAVRARRAAPPPGRPGARVEVFMLRRVPSMAFAPRMWVFPGGGVDPRDDAPDLPWAGPTPAEWAERLGCDLAHADGGEGLARALVCAAVREVFEECGVLLAGPSPDTVVADLRHPEWDSHRAALLAGELSFAQLLLRRRLVLRSDLLSVQGRWVTPEFEPRRYDTYFFAALLPDGQMPDDDTSEADLGAWVRPADLLQEHASGDAVMLPPTVVCLERIRDASSAASLVARSRSAAPVRPRLVEADGGPVIRAELP